MSGPKALKNPANQSEQGAGRFHKVRSTHWSFQDFESYQSLKTNMRSRCDRQHRVDGLYSVHLANRNDPIESLDDRNDNEVDSGDQYVSR